jgi:hypothetical protein
MVADMYDPLKDTQKNAHKREIRWGRMPQI